MSTEFEKSILALVAQLQQDVANLKQDNQQLKEQVQQLKKKDEEREQQLQIVEILRNESKVDIPEAGDDAAVQKILDGCSFPFLTEKINLSDRQKVAGPSLQRIIAECPNVRELDSSHSHTLTNWSLGQIASLRHLKLLDVSFCDKLTNEGLKHLSSMTSLTSLNLSNTEFEQLELTSLDLSVK
jgi:F-box/leucine-rich repeat protein 2/20